MASITGCARCGVGKLPWLWVKELNGFVCFDCSFLVPNGHGKEVPSDQNKDKNGQERT